MEKKIINDSSIWDLHIHTCNSPKSTGEFQTLGVEAYVDKLLEVFSDYEDLTLISFTDHNLISYEVYKEFYDRKSDISLLPGIEVDVMIDGIKEAKHLIFYFNIEPDNLEKFATDINMFLQDKNSVKINEILEFLVSKKVEFLISPHAFKQGKRSINYDWNDEKITGESVHKYMDQFFCFWEASGYSDIAKAIEFLKNIDMEEQISIISFSDASDSTKLKSYLSNPPQYFKSLPNFKGVQLAGTDSRRILKHKKLLDINNSGNIIGSININGEEIKLSDRLNAIVGGRGSGKSILIDNLALNMDSSIRENKSLKDDRISFLDTISISLNNLDGTKITIDSKKIDFFDQAYVSKIFNSNNISSEIETYFQDEFKNLGEINKEFEIQKIKLKYEENLKSDNLSKPTSNVSNFIGKYKKIDDKVVGIKVKKTDICQSKKISFDVESAFTYAKTGSKLIPPQLKNNKNVNLALNSLLKVIVDEIAIYNNEQEILNLENIIKKKCIEFNESKSKDIKDKNQEEEKLIQHFKYECSSYIERTKIVNSLIYLENNHQPEKSLSDIKDGIDGNKFKFEKKIKFEKPLSYFRRQCVNYMGKKYENDETDNLINEFIYKINDEIKNSKTINDFISELKTLSDYQVTYESNILYGKDDKNFENIINMSPGTQTNILMEYIVSKQTEIPLLIDQPEDNIDNETIYSKLTEWFENLKMKRQVIVVTHDANIVINADAENVIIATKNENNSFNYIYGALEYGDILNRISIILDGGVEAVERRLKKYGREKNKDNN